MKRLLLCAVLLLPLAVRADTITFNWLGEVAVSTSGYASGSYTNWQGYSFSFSLSGPYASSLTDYWQYDCGGGPCPYHVTNYSASYAGPIGSIHYSDGQGMDLYGSFNNASAGNYINSYWDSYYYRAVNGDFTIYGTDWVGTGTISAAVTNSPPSMSGPRGSVNIAIQPVPEPSTILLLISGLGCCLPFIRRKRC